MKKTKQVELSIYDVIDAPEADYLYMGNSTIANAGKGLFTAIAIYQDEIISVFKGEILTDTEAKRRAILGEDDYFISLLNGQILDSKHTHCFAKYANDAQGYLPSGFVQNAMITTNEKGKVCLVAIRDIAAGDEIFCSYGRRYWKKRTKSITS